MLLNAAEAGADCVKFQLFETEHLISPEYLSDIVPIFKKHELSRKQYLELARMAEKHGVGCTASVFDPTGLKWYARETSPPFIKIASGDITYRRLLEAAAETDIPVLLSTGAATDQEISQALKWLGPVKEKTVLLHCISRYPAPDSSLNLRRINDLADKFYLPVGFSDHSQSEIAPALAASRGATVWERHVTTDPTLEGPEHTFSLPISDLPGIINKLHNPQEILDSTPKEEITTLLGEKEPALTESDLEYRKNARRCLMADRKLTAGQTLSEDLIRELRPHIEIGAEYIYDYTGKKLTTDIEPLSLLTPDKLI